ncbi:hypothetical protein CAPTEDRAFT_214248 [Capitella teleta]|uniref:DUF7869 domain-containing protein n=1 Tax=Capitella teleta TaxID=283909 RepID=R7V9B9_CAPTE|nr:hypothetical protein CAPTEDRAFT_214248 [Capitella teleta]|eukprot:ELU12956.1 hypothetical protein CAPTEDRAFT_214248 [Capitella teleta]
MCDQAKAVCKAEGIDALQESAACSRRMTMHYSFDYAQQVHLPSNPLQPGPIFFLVPRKAGLFGVCCEGLPRQVNFLIDKAHLISKGSNVVVSFLHHFFERYGLGETDVHLHCDNCSVQNKNKFVLWYIAWRVAVGLHKSITLNFLVAGHTKFAPDWCFGLVKQTFRRHVVNSVSCLAAVVNGSASCNEAAVVGTEDGHNNIPVMDWQGHFAGIGRDFHGIKQYQHFRMRSSRTSLDALLRVLGGDAVFTGVDMATTTKEYPKHKCNSRTQLNRYPEHCMVVTLPLTVPPSLHNSLERIQSHFGSVKQSGDRVVTSGRSDHKYPRGLDLVDPAEGPSVERWTSLMSK